MEKRSTLMQYEAHMNALSQQAYALGWLPRDQASEDSYRQRVIRARSLQQP